MQLISFTPNASVRLFNKLYSVQAIEDNKRVTLRAEGGATRTWDLEVLISHYHNGNLKAGVPHKQRQKPARRVAHRTISDASPKARDATGQRLTFLRAIERSGVRVAPKNEALTEVLQRAAKECGAAEIPSISTLKRWIRRAARSGGDSTAVVPSYHRRGGRGQLRAAEEVQVELQATIDNVFLTPEKPSVRQAYMAFAARLVEMNRWRPAAMALRVPSYDTFLRQVRARSGYEITAARDGERAARMEYRSVTKSSERFAFNECWEVDHTVLDVFVVCPFTKLPLGRPRLTVMAEYQSRMPMAFDVGFDGNSAIAVMNCLRTAIKPKDYVKEKYPEVQGVWNTMGVPAVLKCDNGKEFHSDSLRDACFELGIELQYCPARSPWFKGRIERMLGTVSRGLLSSLPGATEAHFYKRKDGVDPTKHAVIDLHTLNRILHVWFIDEYMNTSHSGIKATPREYWDARFNMADVELPASVDQLDIICSETESRKLAGHGIEIANCKFNSFHLQKLRRELALTDVADVQVKYNPSCLSHVWVRDPRTDERLEVPNIDPDKKDLSASQVALIEKFRRAQSDEDLITIKEARRRIAEIYMPLLQARTQRQRRNAFKILGLQTDGTLSDAIPPSKPKTRAAKPASSTKKSAQIVEVRQPRPSSNPSTPVRARPSIDTDVMDDIPTFSVRHGSNGMESPTSIHGGSQR